MHIPDAYPLVISQQLPSPSPTKTWRAKENSRNSTFPSQKHLFLYVCINFFIVCHIIFYHFHLYIRLDLPTPTPHSPQNSNVPLLSAACAFYAQYQSTHDCSRRRCTLHSHRPVSWNHQIWLGSPC